MRPSMPQTHVHTETHTRYTLRYPPVPMYMAGTEGKAVMD